ncbi:MAG: glycosyltransferase, partial [Acidimicrobiales bacterium]
MTPRPFAVVTGGGTGGHVAPALAVAEALVELGHPRESVYFVGGRRGIEATLVPAEGFKLIRLRGRGIQRRLTVENLGAAGGLLAALARAVVMAGRQRPRVVITVGGYAGLPYALASLLW